MFGPQDGKSDLLQLKPKGHLLLMSPKLLFRSSETDWLGWMFSSMKPHGHNVAATAPGTAFSLLWQEKERAMPTKAMAFLR